MYFFLYYIILLFFYKCMQSYAVRKDDQIADNIDSFMVPLRKIYGLFPNREFEIQFDFEHVNYDEVQTGEMNKHRTRSIMRSKNTSEATTGVASDSITSDPGKRIVYMNDLKKALEEYEKEHPQNDCTKKAPTFGSLSLSTLNDNPSLSDVLKLIKKGAKLQNYTPKGDDGLNWIKIKVPV